MLDGFHKLGGSTAEQLTELAKRSGGIPDFAMDALKKAGLDARTVDQADADGRAAARKP